MTPTRIITAAALALALSAPAFAEYTVEIHGNYTTESHVGAVDAKASGQNADASINVTGVQGSGLVDYSAKATTGNLTSSATGTAATARQNIGGIQSHN